VDPFANYYVEPIERARRVAAANAKLQAAGEKPLKKPQS
jgi:hypothetical protein